MIQDSQIGWLRKKVRYSPLELNALITPAVNEAGSNVFTEGELLQNPQASSKTAPEFFQFEVSTFGIVGIGMTNQNSVALLGYVPCPSDLNPNFPIGLRLGYTCNGVGTLAAPGLHVGFDKAGVAIQADTVLDDAVNTVDTPVSNITTATGWILYITSRAIKKVLYTLSPASGPVTRDMVEEGGLLRFRILPQGTIPTSTTLLFVELDYVPWLTMGEGCQTDRPLTHVEV